LELNEDDFDHVGHPELQDLKGVVEHDADYEQREHEFLLEHQLVGLLQFDNACLLHTAPLHEPAQRAQAYEEEDLVLADLDLGEGLVVVLDGVLQLGRAHFVRDEVVHFGRNFLRVELDLVLLEGGLALRAAVVAACSAGERQFDHLVLEHDLAVVNGFVQDARHVLQLVHAVVVLLHPDFGAEVHRERGFLAGVSVVPEHEVVLQTAVLAREVHLGLHAAVGVEVGALGEADEVQVGAVLHIGALGGHDGGGVRKELASQDRQTHQGRHRYVELETALGHQIQVQRQLVEIYD